MIIFSFQSNPSYLEMKADLVLALKNAHDPRRFGLLLPIREWLSGLTEENLLSLLGKITISLSVFFSLLHVDMLSKSLILTGYCRKFSSRQNVLKC